MGVLTLYRHWLVSTPETVRGCSTRHSSLMEGSTLIALVVASWPYTLRCTADENSPAVLIKSVSEGYTITKGPGDTYLETTSLNSSIFSLLAGVSDVDVHEDDRSLWRGIVGGEKRRATVADRNQGTTLISPLVSGPNDVYPVVLL